MRTLACLVLSMLAALPASLNAETGAPLPPATFDIPFDDIDPVVAQAELNGHITTFLNRLQHHWGSSPAALRDQVTGDIARDEREALVVAGYFADHGVLEGYDFREGSLVEIGRAYV